MPEPCFSLRPCQAPARPRNAQVRLRSALQASALPSRSHYSPRPSNAPVSPCSALRASAPASSIVRPRSAIQAAPLASGTQLSFRPCHAPVRPRSALQASAPRCTPRQHSNPSPAHGTHLSFRPCPASSHSLFSGAPRCTSEAQPSSASLCPCILAFAFLSGPAMHCQGPAQPTRPLPFLWGPAGRALL